ncbi:arsenate reductase family protein [Caldalkalibacillus mannanilyticus]|uniref:arsenate reductase family protein n=1 Tax=Caldalkalibacillus mannanilyticus TaxID=1418 RepID=UPI000553BD24|nr:arsenate reductase family protein [Caldalkalibacillus mannanilyticus]
MSNMTAYLYPKCGTCRKAKSWLVGQEHQLEEINIAEQPPSKEELERLWKLSGVELKKIFNTSGNKYKELGLKDKLATMSEEEQLALLASDGMLIKRPIVTNGTKVTIGFKEDSFAEVWGK